MNVKEKGLVVVFITALMGWIFSHHLGLNESSVAIIAMGGALLFNIISWGDVLQNKGGWNTLIWYGGIIGLSSTLSKEGFFHWLAAFLSEHLDFLSAGNMTIFIIVFLSVLVRYFFASGGAYVAAMVPLWDWSPEQHPCYWRWRFCFPIHMVAVLRIMVVLRGLLSSLRGITTLNRGGLLALSWRYVRF